MEIITYFFQKSTESNSVPLETSPPPQPTVESELVLLMRVA
ncbi:hypothetical protein [Laspinema olomoucense]|nr:MULTISPECIES: hypothetical protein [unclassified Laspinema]